MSKKQWMALLMLFLTYLLLGASIFYHIESRLEVEKVNKAREERIQINALLHEHYMPKNTEEQHEIFDRLTRYCGKSVLNYTKDETDPLKWDFYNSFYFAYTVVSTIGYGNLAPTNMLSRILMIFYGVVGIPMNGILLSQLGEFFGLVFVRAHKKYKSYKLHSHQNDYTKKLTPLETRKAGLAAQIFMYLTPGFVMFIFFPAFLFSHYEGWAYDEAVYYAFVTLTTIGFGDYVAGQDNTKGSGVLFILYKSFLIAWISFGLGYIVMIMTFIARGMRSKKITRLEHKLAVNLKHTQSKIWNEFNKEVGYLRRVFNELQLSKVKRVYVDEYDYEAPLAKFPRSNSFPDLRDLVYGGLPNPLPPHPRRRANSEVVPMEAPVARVVSETDLQRIDKTATFATHAMVQPAELLARLVNILGYIPPPPDTETNDIDEVFPPSVTDTDTIKASGGVHGFTDKDILSSEKAWNVNTTWKLGGDYDKSVIGAPDGRKPRSRAASEIRLANTKYDPNLQQRDVEWTWSGPSASRKIQEMIKARKNNVPTQNANLTKETKSKFANLTLPISVTKTLLPRWIKQLSNKREAGERTRNSVSVDDLESSRERENYYLSQTSGGGPAGELEGFSSGYDIPPPGDAPSRPYFTHTGGANLASSLESSNLLEETSLADFLRALTVLHTRVAAATGATVQDEYVKKPQRKMGTACLTPPKLPSLLALFSPPSGMGSPNQSHQNTLTSGANAASRRFSLRTGENSPGTLTPDFRRSSLAQPIVKSRRRFSLRPVIGHNGSPYVSGIPSQSSSAAPPPPPPPPSYTSEAFVVECPKESLVKLEGVTGVSTPVGRFSLRPTTQTESPSQVASPPSPPPLIAKGLPRWRAGMLQRQINQINLQRRVRAFSLSDVNSEPPRHSPSQSPISPLVKSQKSVTIVSPSPTELGARRTNEAKQFSVVQIPATDNQPEKPRREPYVRAHSTTNNPFASDTQSTNSDDDSTASGSNSQVSSSTATTAEESESVKIVTATSPNRKVSAVSIGHWTDSPRRAGGSRKVSAVSAVSERSTESLASSSRKSSTSQNSSDKPRVSIDSYKPLMEANIEKPSENPFERYKANMQMANDSEDSLTDVKVEATPGKRKFSTKLGAGPRESFS